MAGLCTCLPTPSLDSSALPNASAWRSVSPACGGQPALPCSFSQVPHAVHVLTEPAPGRGRSSIGAALCTASHELGASCVVVASQTSGGLQEWLRGSVASHLTHHCQVRASEAPRAASPASGPWSQSCCDARALSLL